MLFYGVYYGVYVLFVLFLFFVRCVLVLSAICLENQIKMRAHTYTVENSFAETQLPKYSSEYASELPLLICVLYAAAQSRHDYM